MLPRAICHRSVDPRSQTAFCMAWLLVLKNVMDPPQETKRGEREKQKGRKTSMEGSSRIFLRTGVKAFASLSVRELA